MEIDIVCEGIEELLIGECKWQNEIINMDILEKVKSRSHLFPKYERVYTVLFSNVGFSKEVEKAAEEDKQKLLFTMDDLFKD